MAGIASAQETQAFTKPVGYQTIGLKQGFNIVGANFVGAPLVAGALTGVDGADLTDDNADYSGLDTSKAHTIEFENGAWSEIAAINAQTITTSTDISGSVASGDTYIIRAQQTLSDLFGENNSAGLGAGGDQSTADIVWVPNGVGGFVKYFYADGSDPFGVILEGWNNVDGNVLSPDAPVLFTDGVIVQRKAAEDLDVVFTGHVKTSPTSVAISGDFVYTYLNRIYPSGVTLENSGMQNSGTIGGDQSASDIIWTQQADDLAAYDKWYYADGSDPFGVILEGWHDVATNGDANEAPLTSAFIYQNKGGAFDMLRTPPDFYGDL